MTICVGSKVGSKSVSSTSVCSQSTVPFIDIKGKTPEELRQIAIKLINYSFTNSKLGTPKEYIEKISENIPGLFDAVRKAIEEAKTKNIKDDISLSLHAADALSRNDPVLAQALIETKVADKTRVAATLAFIGNHTDQVEQLIEEGADPASSLASLVLAVERGDADVEEVLSLLHKYSFVNEAQFKLSYSETDVFQDKVIIYALRRNQIEFANKLFPHANKKEVLAKYCIQYGADHTKMPAVLAFIEQRITEIKNLPQGANPINTLAWLVLAADKKWVDVEEVTVLLRKYLFAKDFDAFLAYAEPGDFLDRVAIYALQQKQFELANKLFKEYASPTQKERIADEACKYLQNQCENALVSIQQELDTVGEKSEATQSQVWGIFKIFVVIVNWLFSLSTRSNEKPNAPLRVDLDELPPIALTA